MKNIFDEVKKRGIWESVFLVFYLLNIKIRSMIAVPWFRFRGYDIDYSATLYKKVILRISTPGSIKIGQNCGIGDYSRIRCFGLGQIKIGKNVSINEYAIIHSGQMIKIGDNVTLGAFCYINDTNHSFEKKDRPINLQEWKAQGIEIEDDVWLGANVTVLDGVKIGKGAVVGAGAVVTKNIDSYSVAVGVPAKAIYSR